MLPFNKQRRTIWFGPVPSRAVQDSVLLLGMSVVCDYVGTQPVAHGCGTSSTLTNPGINDSHMIDFFCQACLRSPSALSRQRGLLDDILDITALLKNLCAEHLSKPGTDDNEMQLLVEACKCVLMDSAIYGTNPSGPASAGWVSSTTALLSSLGEYSLS